MIDIDSISLAERLINEVADRLPRDKRPVGEKLKTMIIRIAASIEANSLTLCDKVLLDLELKSLKSASDIVRKVFSEELNYLPPGDILPEVFDQRSSLPEVAAEFGVAPPGRRPPTKEALAIFDELIERPDYSRKFERDAILMPDYPFDQADPRHTVAVESGADRDKFKKLDDALEHSRFFKHIETARLKSGKSGEDFKIVIKTHLIPMMAREEVGVYVDPTLVLYLVSKLTEAGYLNVTIAEGRNSYGNWFNKRGVVRVAARAGYIDEDECPMEGQAPYSVTGYVLANKKPHPYRFIDLSMNTVEHNFKDDILKVHPINKEWVEADYRISFAKLKTHFAVRYALHMVNVSLALPKEDRLIHYPTQEDSARAAVSLVKEFPIHFSLIDGITASDKLLGYTHRPTPRKPGLIVAGQDMIATASLAAQLIGVDPFESVYMREAAKGMGGLTPYRVVGHAPLVKPWRNIRSSWVVLLTKVVEGLPKFSNFWVPLFIARRDSFFTPKGGENELRKRELWRLLTGVRMFLFFLTLDNIPKVVFDSLTEFRSKRLADRLKITNRDPEFADDARHLSSDDWRRLRQILETHGNEIAKGKADVKRMGHVVAIGDHHYPFIDKDALGAICAGKILKGVRSGKWTPAEIDAEADGWMAIRKTKGSRL